MNDLKTDEELAKLSLGELVDLGMKILEDIRIRLMQIAGDIEDQDEEEIG